MKLKLIFFSLFTLTLVAGCTSRIGDELEGNVKLSLLGDYEVVAHTKASDFTEEELAAFQSLIPQHYSLTLFISA